MCGVLLKAITMTERRDKTVMEFLLQKHRVYEKAAGVCQSYGDKIYRPYNNRQWILQFQRTQVKHSRL